MPDNDKPGQSYIEKVGRLIPRGNLFILNLEWLSKKLGKQLSEGYDLADAEADGLTAEDMRQAIEAWRRQVEAAKRNDAREDKLQALNVCFIFPYTPTDSNPGATRATTNGNAGPAVAPEKKAGATGATEFPKENERPCYRVYDEWLEEQDRKHKLGVYYHGIKDTKEGPQLFDLWVCGPLHVDADLCTHAGTDFGLMLRFMNRRGIWRQWAMPMELLKGSGEELHGELLALGLSIDLPNRAYLSRYLSTRVTARRLKSALTVGWHDQTFVLPDRVIGDEDVFFQSEHASQSEYSNRGTLSEWRKEIAARCVGNPFMMFAISVAFAGCLLELVHMDGGGVHYFGSSSEGKTTCVRAGCSVWGGAN